MGAYLSQPITKKESSDHEGTKVSCGASSMQGWRIYQEDAHNVIIDFDENKSLFAVYDGHGGSEVALYTSQHLPEFIKNTAEFKKGNYKQALIDAFMEFDESLIKDEVMAILKTLKNENEGEDSYPATDEDALDENDDENVSNLYEEATMPLSEVISRYRNPVQRLKESGGKPMSPCLKAKDKKTIKGSDEGCSSSSGGSSVAASAEAAGSSSSKAEVELSSSSSSSSSSKPAESKPESESVSSSTAVPSKSEEPSSSGNTEVKSEETNTTTPVTTSSTNDNSTSGNDVTSSSTKPEENGSESVEKQSNGAEAKKENGEEVKAENGEKEAEEVISPSKAKPIKGKAKDKPAIITNGDSGELVDKAPLTNGNGKKRTSPRKLGTKNLLESTMEDDSSESDEDFQVDEDSSSDDDDEADNSHLPNDDEDVSDEEEDLEEEEDSDEDDSDFDGEGAEGLSREDIQKRMKEALDHKDIPGMDSGCTAVVVLFVDNQVYIANAGDSRAVLCRDALAKDLSEDHKPEDEVEKKRIVKAGGEVTPDGRVNGGLNLSRALGDHSYKQTSSLPLSQQMITALPDVETLTLTPQDEFIVIACDGIWNSLSSQEVVDFVRERINQEDKKLSTICEELFDTCLAPDSLGDGTGCDNMTCVLVKLSSSSSSSGSVAPSVGSAKRSRDPEPSQGENVDSGDKTSDESTRPAKKPKTEAAATAAVESSVAETGEAMEAQEV